MNSVFSELLNKISLPDIKSEAIESSPPEFVYRIIFIYSRSSTIPKWKSENPREFTKFNNSPICFFDSIFLHKTGKDNPNMQKVFDYLNELEDDNKISYIFEIGTSLKKVYDYFAKLIAHPLQRCSDADWKNTFSD